MSAADEPGQPCGMPAARLGDACARHRGAQGAGVVSGSRWPRHKAKARSRRAP